MVQLGKNLQAIESVDNKNDGMQFQLHVQLHFAHNNVKKPTGTAMHISEFHVVVLHGYIN